MNKQDYNAICKIYLPLQIVFKNFNFITKNANRYTDSCSRIARKSA